MAPMARPSSPRTVAEAFSEAAAAAGHAPSFRNTQPWRWRLTGDVLDLFLERDRLLPDSDDDGLHAMISCGAALHHARLALAAHGWRVTVIRLPTADSAHLARLRMNGPAPAGSTTARRASAIRLRHTDLRPVTGKPLTPEDLAAIRIAVESQNTRLHVLRSDEILDIAVATRSARVPGTAMTQWQHELGLWTGDGRIVGAAGEGGDGRIMGTPGMGRPGEQSSAGGHDRAGTFAVLHGDGNTRLDWLHAGEALSAGWLAATEAHVSVLPLSTALQEFYDRKARRRLLAGLGHPYLVVRLGRHTTADGAPRASRLPPDQIFDRVEI
jgi:hypothetical protein